MIVTTAEEMRALDRWTIEHGTAGAVLMERAGAGAARVLRERLVRRGAVAIVCGRGNNGGDGFVIARHLRRARLAVELWLVGSPDEVRGDAALMLGRWRRSGGKVQRLASEADVATLRRRLERAAAVVDALFGTGLNAPVTGVAAAAIDAMNASGTPILAIDIASGLSADTGRTLGTAVRATVTATFAFPKVGQCIHPGVDHTGLLTVVDIGIPAAAVTAVGPRTVLLEAQDVGHLLPPRACDTHKGTYGHVLVVAGSRGKSGAALLACEAAARTGAGLTTLAVPATLQDVVEGQVREVMTMALPDGADGSAALGDGHALDVAMAGKSAVVCGPGLGVTEGTRALVAHLVRRCTQPLVLDADALNAVAGTDVLRERSASTVITPHPGEMARQLGSDTATVQADRLGAARRLARDARVTVVLKGARTIVASPDGSAAICPTGNPGMASGGMGDVLSGVVGALLAQGLAAGDAAALAVFAHGLAADTVAGRRGQVGLLARDVVDELPPTLCALQAAARGDRAGA